VTPKDHGLGKGSGAAFRHRQFDPGPGLQPLMLYEALQTPRFRSCVPPLNDAGAKGLTLPRLTSSNFDLQTNSSGVNYRDQMKR